MKELLEEYLLMCFKSRFVEQRPHRRPKTVIIDLVLLLVRFQKAESENGVEVFFGRLQSNCKVDDSI